MSFAFFVELDLVVAEQAWDSVLKLSPEEVDVPEWWPAEKSVMRDYFRANNVLQRRTSFGEILDAAIFQIGTHDTDLDEDGNLVFRLAALLDRSQLELGGAIGALLFAVGGAGTGSLMLVNDGTGPDENGWRFTLQEGQVSVETIADVWTHVDRLGPEVLGDFEDF